KERPHQHRRAGSLRAMELQLGIAATPRVAHLLYEPKAHHDAPPFQEILPGIFAVRSSAEHAFLHGRRAVQITELLRQLYRISRRDDAITLTVQNHDRHAG